LIEEGINSSYDSLKIEQLKSKVLEIIEPINLNKIHKLLEAYENAKTESLGSSDLEEVVKAACESRVKTILIEEDRIVPGEINHDTGGMNSCNMNAPDCDDILDDLAELVLKNRGKVWVLPKDKMPSLTGVAAIYRYR